MKIAITEKVWETLDKRIRIVIAESSESLLIYQVFRLNNRVMSLILDSIGPFFLGKAALSIAQWGEPLIKAVFIYNSHL